MCVCWRVHIGFRIPALHVRSSYKWNDYVHTHTECKKCFSHCTFHMLQCSQFLCSEEVSDMNTVSIFLFACEF